MDVVEPPPMAGLPAVEGRITLTVDVVEDPKLPDPPPPPVPVDDSGGNSRIRNSENDAEWSRLVFASATVYDHSRTLLRCHPNGDVQKEITVWSNLDFNHFTGFSTFEVRAADGKIRRYELIMGVGDEDTQRRGAMLARHDMEYIAPEIPALPDDKPAYGIVEAAPDAGAVQLVEDLHELYRVEGGRMEAAYRARIQAEVDLRTPAKSNDGFWCE